MKFDWCVNGRHGECLTKFQRFYHGMKKDGRKNVPAVIYLDEFWTCDCKCHTKSNGISGKKGKK